MLSLNGVSAWIQVDGKELDQHGVERDPNQNQVTCWIAAQANKHFTVAFRDDSAYREHSLTSYLKLDGATIPGRVLFPSGSAPNCARDRTVVQHGHLVSQSSSRPFLFSKLELTDDDKYLNRPSTYLGEIQISIYRVQVIGMCIVQGSNVSGHGKVHERSKKAVTHCVSYGMEVPTQTPQECIISFLDSSAPLAKFVFKYRDLGLLQANGIIHNLRPAKKRVVEPADVLDLTMSNDVERRSISGEVEVVEARSTGSLLSEGSISSKRTKKIKQEENFVRGEVIDLT